MAELYNASGEIIGGDDFDISEFDLIHTFTAFDADYSTENSTPRVLDIDTETFLDTFYNHYLGNNDNGVFVGKKELGKDESGQHSIWQYELRPIDKAYKKTILLSSGLHTYELPASFGLARWVKEFMESPYPVFQYMRQNVRVILIPIMNPWGFNQNPKTYGNVNGVNINRNFDTWDGAWASFPVVDDEWNRKGELPFSEVETQIIREWATAHDYADFWIDCHTGVNNPVEPIWCYYSSSNPNVAKIKNAISALKVHITDTYGVQGTAKETIDHEGFIKGFYGTDVAGIPTMTLEQCQANGTAFTTVPNNNPVAIVEYATQLHAFIMAQLK